MQNINKDMSNDTKAALNRQDDFIMKPKVDICFKNLMEEKAVCTGFLSAILDIPPESIDSIQYMPTGTRMEYGNDKLGILDVRLKLNNRQELDIEMQATNFKWWIERSLFYLCRLYTGQIQTGQKYNNLQKCIHIGILNFELFDDKPFHSLFHLWEDRRRQLYTDKLEIHVLELPKLKTNKYPESDLLNWARFFNSENRKEMEALAAKNENIDNAYRHMIKLSANEMKRLEYEAREKALRDYDSQMSSSHEEGVEEGIEEGIRRVVRNMLNRNIPYREILELTDISDEQLKEIQRHLGEKERSYQK